MPEESIMVIRHASLCALGAILAGCATRQPSPAGPPPPVLVTHTDTLEGQGGSAVRRSETQITIHPAQSDEGHPPALVVVDGRRMSNEELARTGINPASIVSVSLVKGDSAVARYGEGTAAGVLVITTRPVVATP
jgi:hypothetical protein